VFDDSYTLEVGSQTLQLDYRGGNHVEAGSQAIEANQGASQPRRTQVAQSCSGRMRTPVWRT